MAKNGPIEGSLTLGTLSGTYEAARQIVILSEIDKISTYPQMSARLKIIARDPDLVKRFHEALELLSDSSKALGLTALISPADHPLVVRAEFKPR